MARGELLIYAEFFSRAHGLDVDFDPEFQKSSLAGDMWVKARQASQLLAMSDADKALAPTEWQASRTPITFAAASALFMKA